MARCHAWGKGVAGATEMVRWPVPAHGAAPPSSGSSTRSAWSTRGIQRPGREAVSSTAGLSKATVTTLRNERCTTCSDERSASLVVSTTSEPPAAAPRSAASAGVSAAVSLVPTTASSSSSWSRWVRPAPWPESKPPVVSSRTDSSPRIDAAATLAAADTARSSDAALCAVERTSSSTVQRPCHGRSSRRVMSVSRRALVRQWTRRSSSPTT